MASRIWIALLLGVSSLLVYAQVRHFDFVSFDDYVYVIQNPNLRLGLSADGVARAFSTYASNWIPLTALSLQLDYALYGLSPAGYHLTNLALHALSSILLFFALQGMTRQIWASAFVAAVFALHPLHVESVAWVSERKDALSGLFFMLTLLAYMRYTERRKSLARYLMVLACMALGLMAKPMLVTLPFVLLLLDFWPLGRLRARDSNRAFEPSALRRALLEKLPMLILSGISSALTISAQRESAMRALISITPEMRVANALESYAIYLGRTVWPSELAVFYPYPLEPAARASVFVAAAFLLVISVLVVRRATTQPYLLVGWLWYLGTLVPVIGLVQVGDQAHADRYMYLPMIGLCIMVAWGVAGLVEKLAVDERVVAGLATLLLCALALATWNQVGTWRNTETLYRHALSVTTNNYFAHKALADELLKQRLIDEAVDHYHQAARVRPDWAPARVGLADSAIAGGRIAEGLRAYEVELQLNPTDTRLIGRYGLALGLVGRYDEARYQLDRCLRNHDGTAELHRAMADIEAALGNTRAAVEHGREALRLRPGYTDAAINLSWWLATSDDVSIRSPSEAIRWIEAASVDSRDPWLLNTLAAAYASAGHFEQAVETAEKALEITAQTPSGVDIPAARARLKLYRAGKPYIESSP